MHPECAKEVIEQMDELLIEYKNVNFKHELVLANLKTWLQQQEEQCLET